MTTKKEKELTAFHARQAQRNKNTPSVDSIFERKSLKPAMPEKKDTPSDVLNYSHDNDRHYQVARIMISFRGKSCVNCRFFVSPPENHKGRADIGACKDVGLVNERSCCSAWQPVPTEEEA